MPKPRLHTSTARTRLTLRHQNKNNHRYWARLQSTILRPLISNHQSLLILFLTLPHPHHRLDHPQHDHASPGGGPLCRPGGGRVRGPRPHGGGKARCTFLTFLLCQRPLTRLGIWHCDTRLPEVVRGWSAYHRGCRFHTKEAAVHYQGHQRGEGGQDSG